MTTRVAIDLIENVLQLFDRTEHDELRSDGAEKLEQIRFEMLLHDSSRALRRLQDLLVLRQLCFDVDEEADDVLAPIVGSGDVVVLPNGFHFGNRQRRSEFIVGIERKECVEDEWSFA